MSAAPIDFYFDFSSPYGYIASRLAADIEQSTGRRLRWRPVLLGAIFKTTGQTPLTEVPLKGEYSRRDFARTARLHKVDYRQPEPFPVGTVAACRAFYALEPSDPQAARSLAEALYLAYFRDNRDISSAAGVLAVAKESGLDVQALARSIEDPAVKDRTRRAVEEAIAVGVFGSPYFVADGEPFWGVDRIPMLESWVCSGGW